MVIRSWDNRPFVPKQGERGYILVTAMWLLLLGASIVALLMLKNLGRGEEISFEREQLQIQYVQESAVETVVADMLFNGPRGEFVLLPAKTSYIIDGTQVTVRVTSESGKIDVNQADPSLIDRALRGFGISALQRQSFISQIKVERANGRLFQSNGDVESAMEKSGIIDRDGFCVSRYFTVYSGLASPQTNQMDAPLARALGQPTLEAAGKAGTGAAMKIEITSDGNAPLNVIIRTSGLVSQSHSVLDWRYAANCN
ncbi:MAG: hypothetical protein ABJN65_01165 [Parasphingorhabdus sp.]